LSGALVRGGLRQPIVDGASDEEIFAALAAAEVNPPQGPESRRP